MEKKGPVARLTALREENDRWADYCAANPDDHAADQAWRKATKSYAKAVRKASEGTKGWIPSH